MSESEIVINSPKRNIKIGRGQPCFVIAEMSANHKQDYNRAVAMVKAAAEVGADAIKLQSYLPETMTIDCRKQWFLVGGKENPEAWQGQTFYELYQKAFTPREWHQPLKELAESLGLIFFPTPYSIEDIEFLETLNPVMYKVASYEATDVRFLKRLAETKRPIIMSVGFATMEEIELSVKVLKEAGARDVIILHCVTSYTDNPRPETSNLRTMLDMSERFGLVSGFSDNNWGIEIPVLAAAMGAAVVEKHFVLESDEALDSRFSLDRDGFKKMVDAIRSNERIMGTVHYGTQTPAEEHNRQFRRSLFVVKNIKKGEEFSPENVRSIRPAFGLQTKYFDEIIGKKATQDIEIGTPLGWDLII